MKIDTAGTEIQEAKSPTLENYKNIRPETTQTPQEVNDFWNGEFQKESEHVEETRGEGNPEYKDDNDITFRDEDRLFPNSEFTIRDYKYKTDEWGRVISTEGKLRLKSPEHIRNMEDVRTNASQEYRDTDDRGHLIAHQFDASDGLENLVPMDAKLNRGDYAKLENTLAKAVGDGADVNLKVEPKYENDSTRPSEFRVSYSIDGERDVVVFKNERGDK